MAENSSSDLAVLYAAQVAGARVGGPSLDDYDAAVRYRHEVVTIASGASTGDYFTLSPVLEDGIVVIPWLSGLSYPTGSTGTLNTTFTLSKVSTAGTVVDLTGLATGNGLVFDAFLDFAAATTLPTCAATDVFRLYMTTVTTATAGRTIKVHIAYRKKGC